MVDAITRLPTGRLRLSRIVYFTDLQHTDSRELPIGVVAEVLLPSLHAIGTALRPGFSGAEMSMIGRMMRDSLAKPIDFLWPEILDAFKTSEPGRALDRFAARHSSSLAVLAPVQIETPRQWLVTTDEEKLLHLVKSRMQVTLVDQYFELMFPPREDVSEPNVRELAEAA
jgi:hypothetical protein